MVFPGGVSVFASLEQVRDEPVIILTSASGIGKSTALAEEHTALTACASCLVDLKRLAGKQDPVTYLSEQTEMPAEVLAEVWYMHLDGFDEAVKLVPNLIELLRQWLGRWPEAQRDRLRLRLATRPAEPENMALEDLLREFWPDPGAVVVRDMAPLTRDDVLRAAHARGLPNPGSFVTGLEQRGLVPAASLPVPLKTLLDRSADGHPLPATGERVYRLACEQLCEEASRARQRPQGLGLQEVMRQAEHLAGVLQFCGNGVLTTALAGGDGLVRLVDVAEAGPGTGGQAEQALRWLTTTPLLRSLSEDEWQFAQQGMQGFLAACYLKDRELAPANVQSLLFAGPGETRYVHPRHRDAAGWLAWHRHEVFSEILRHDPASLLSPDLPAQPPTVRAQVVEALFTAAGAGEELSRLTVLHRASHPGLATQLAVRMTPAAARRAGSHLQPFLLALALALACPDHAPVSELMDVAEDDQVNEGLRVGVLRAVPHTSAAGVAGRLGVLASAPAVQVSATALLALWPQHLPTADLLARMPAGAQDDLPPVARTPSVWGQAAGPGGR